MTVRRHIPWHTRWSVNFTPAHRYGLAVVAVMGGGNVAAVVLAAVGVPFWVGFPLACVPAVAGAGYMCGWWGRR